MQQKTATLTTIFSEVLANLAFMFGDDDECAASPSSSWLETTISYQGPVRGTLQLRCPREFSVLLVANLLGTDVEDDGAESKADDAVKEFMNVLCGQFITATHGAEDFFDLAIPEIHELAEAPDPPGAAATHASTLSVSGHRLDLYYFPETG